MLHAGVVLTALGVDVELRRRERAVDDVALQLGQVDTIRREAAERLVQGGRNAADPEHHGGHARPVAGLRHHALARHDQEAGGVVRSRSEEHTSELQSLMRISYAVFCMKKKKTIKQTEHIK